MQKKSSEIKDYERMIDQLHNDIVVCLDKDINTGEVNNVILKECIERMRGLADILQNDFKI